MTSKVLNKIIQKAKGFDLENFRGYNPQKPSTVIYKQEIARFPEYTEGIFLIHENIHFGAGSVKDSSYSIYEFDTDGNYKGEIEVGKLPPNFFRDRKTIFNIR